MRLQPFVLFDVDTCASKLLSQSSQQDDCLGIHLNYKTVEHMPVIVHASEADKQTRETSRNFLIVRIAIEWKIYRSRFIATLFLESISNCPRILIKLLTYLRENRKFPIENISQGIHRKHKK
jgi:hypothetical protein